MASPILPVTLTKRPNIPQAVQPHTLYTSQNTNLSLPFNKSESITECNNVYQKDKLSEYSQPITQSRKAYTFGKPNTNQSASHQVLKDQDHDIEANKDSINQQVAEDDEDNHKLRQEYLKVKQELEMLKRSGRYKLRSPIPGQPPNQNSFQESSKLPLSRGRPTSQQEVAENKFNQTATQKPFSYENNLYEGAERIDQDQAMEQQDAIQQQFENTQKPNKNSFYKDGTFQKSQNGSSENGGIWQDKVERRIEKLSQRLSDYYQRVNPDLENKDTVLVHQINNPSELNEGVFRGSFSRSNSNKRFPDSKKTISGNKIQYQSSMVSSQNSARDPRQTHGTQSSPIRSRMRIIPQQPLGSIQQAKSKKLVNQVHGLYSAAGARLGSQSRRHNARKTSAAANFANGLSKSMKNNSQQNDSSKIKQGLKSANSYKDVQVIEINDSRLMGCDPSTSRGLMNQANSNSIISQNSQNALNQKKQIINKKNKGKQLNSNNHAHKQDMKMKVISEQIDHRVNEDKLEFKGSFQNKGHRLWAATPQDSQGQPSPRVKTKSRRQQPLNLKSFNSDRSNDSQEGIKNFDKEGPDYSASASNNSKDDHSSIDNDRVSNDDIDNSSDAHHQSTIGTQYSQIVNIRTKHRQVISSSRRSKPNQSQKLKKKSKSRPIEVQDEADENEQADSSAHHSNARNTNRPKTPKQDALSKKNQTARDTSKHQKPQSDQAQVIIDCQRQIQELQAQLQNLTHFPATGGGGQAESSQGSMLVLSQQQPPSHFLGVSRQTTHQSMQSQEIMVQQRHQYPGASTMVGPNFIGYNNSAPQQPHQAMQMGLNSSSPMGFAPFQYQNMHQNNPSQQAFNPIQMQPSYPMGEFQQYEMRIRQLQEQIREQQFQLQMQEQKNGQALWSHRSIQGQQQSNFHQRPSSIEQANHNQFLNAAAQPSQSPIPFQGHSPMYDPHFNLQPSYTNSVTTGPSPQQQLASFTNQPPLTPTAPQNLPLHIQNQQAQQYLPQRPGSGIGIGSQIMPPDTSNITQNNSNFFSQINEIARNMEERGVTRGASIGTMESSAEKFGLREEPMPNDVTRRQSQGRIDGHDGQEDRGPEAHQHQDGVNVQHETDVELTELDAAKLANQDNKDGFNGFETSIVDNQARDSGPSILEKGSFAPLPEFSENKMEEQLEFKNSKQTKDLILQHVVKIDDNYNTGVRSPEFLGRSNKESSVAWLYGKEKIDDKPKEDNEQSDDKQVELQNLDDENDVTQMLEKQDQLLVIGFDQKPKGVNPLERLRSPGRGIGNHDRSRQKQHFSMLAPKGGKTQNNFKKEHSGRNALEFTHSSRGSNVKASMTPKGHPVATINLGSSERNPLHEKASDVIIIGEEVPSLQEYARQKSGRAAKLQSARGNYVSPQPRKSIGLSQHVAGESRVDYLNSRRNEMSQPQKQPKESKTKEELARIRKEMMKTKFKDRNDITLQNKSTLGGRDGTLETSSALLLTTQGNLESESSVPLSRHLKAENARTELLTRLASGTKAKIDKQSMRRLTKDNYEKLPEILKKKEDAKKHEELVKKKERALAYQKELDLRLRNSLRKKKEKDAKR